MEESARGALEKGVSTWTGYGILSTKECCMCLGDGRLLRVLKTSFE